MTKPPAREPSDALTSGLYVAGSLLVLLVFLVKPGINHYEPSLFGTTVDGTAHRPYVQRSLVPVTVRIVANVLPASIRSQLTLAARTPPLRGVLAYFDRIPAELCAEFLIAFFIMWGALLGFLLVLRDLFDAFFKAPRGFVRTVPLMALLLLPPFFRYTSFVYDFPALFFFTLGLALMLRRRWTAYLLVFVLACFNKETTILLTIVFWLNFRAGEIPRRQFRDLLLVQVGAWIAVRGMLGFIYRNNPGSTLEYHLLDHNIDLLRPYDPATAVAYLVLLLLLTYQWGEKPLFLRRGLWIAVPLIGLTLFLGFLDELRDYYELFPILLLLIAHSFGKIIGLEITTRSSPAVVSGRSTVRQFSQSTAVAAAAGVAAILAVVAVASLTTNTDPLRETTPAPIATVSADGSTSLSSAARDAFVTRLSRETPSSAWIEYDGRDDSARKLAEELGAAFDRAHWKVRLLRPCAFPLRPGVVMLVAGEVSRTTDAVAEALDQAGVDHSDGQNFRAYSELKRRDNPNWQGASFTDDQEYVLFVGRPALP